MRNGIHKEYVINVERTQEELNNIFTKIYYQGKKL